MVNRIKWSFFCSLHLLYLASGIPQEDQPTKHQISLQQEHASSEVDDGRNDKKPLTSEEERKLQYLSETFGKRSDWNNLSGMWGKRENLLIPEFVRINTNVNDDKYKWGKKNSWNNLNNMWGKRNDLNDYADNGKRNNWNNLSGMWGKRNNWNNLSGMWGKRNNWNNLSGMWGKRNSDNSESNNKKSNWNGLKSLWGKRSNWNNLSGMWGKKNDWNNLSGMWGKKNDWNNLSGMWGKRLIDEAQVANESQKRTQWNGLNGMWGKRSGDSQSWNDFSNPEIFEEQVEE